MADILIKGMEIPKACSWFDEEGKFHACRFDFACVCSITGDNVATSFERRHQSCPLVEVEEAKTGVVYPTESKMWMEAST